MKYMYHRKKHDKTGCATVIKNDNENMMCSHTIYRALNTIGIYAPVTGRTM